jgi:parvulin-like peptidyl-prolyl isomerase
MSIRNCLAIIFITIVPGTIFAQTTVDEIVARVNSDIILKSELADQERLIRQDLARRIQENPSQRTQLEQAAGEQIKHILRDLIDTTLVLQQAKEMGLNADLEIVKTMERIRQEYKFESTEALEKAIVEQGQAIDEFKQRIRTEYLRQQVIGREVYPRVIITTEEIRNYYESHKTSFDKPAGIQVREIVVATEEKTPAEVEELKKKAEEALAAVKRGDNFAEVATKYSDAETAQNGGDLGFFEKGQLAQQVEDALSGLEKGQSSEILTMPYGFHIFKVEDKHAGGILPFELAQNQIQNTLFQERVGPKLREYLTKLRTDGFYKVNPGYVDTAAPEKVASEADQNPAKN